MLFGQAISVCHGASLHGGTRFVHRATKAFLFTKLKFSFLRGAIRITNICSVPP